MKRDSNMDHECKFEKIPFRIRFLPGQGIESSVRLKQRIYCLFKGRKIIRRPRKKILQCRECGRYSVECPCCHQWGETERVTDVMQCPHCGKVYQARLFEL